MEVDRVSDDDAVNAKAAHRENVKTAGLERSRSGGADAVPTIQKSTSLRRWVAGVVQDLPMANLRELSSTKSWRLLFRVWILTFVGLFLALSDNTYLSRGIGAFSIAIAMSWSDLIAAECRNNRFFPSPLLNQWFGLTMRWQFLCSVCAVLLAVFAQTNVLQGNDYILMFGQFWAVPFMFMLLTRHTVSREEQKLDKNNPFAQRSDLRAQVPQVQRACRMLLDIMDWEFEREAVHESNYNSHGGSRDVVADVVEQVNSVPIYNISVLSQTVANAFHDASDNVQFVARSAAAENDESPASPSVSSASSSSMEIIHTHNDAVPESMKRQQIESTRYTSIFSAALQFVLKPFSNVGREGLFWNYRDLALYSCGALLVLFHHFGLTDNYWIVAAAFSPILIPHSQATRGLKALRKEVTKMYTPVRTEYTPSPSGWGDISIPMFMYVYTNHFFAFVGAFAFFAPGYWSYYTGLQPPTNFTWWFAVFLWYFSGFGITVGAHRLWAHRSYQASALYRGLLMIMNSIANEGPIYEWARDHRVHHLNSDTDADPYNAKRGFFFSHMGWVYRKKNPAVIREGKKLDLRDLENDGFVMFQRKMDPWWNFFWCYGAPTIVCTRLGSDFWYNGLLVCGFFRYIWVLHATWFVNSLVHSVGESRPYDPKHPTRESGFVSVLAHGEGWHNWHHAYGWDYATAELDWWRQFNPSKMFIDACAFLGLVWGRKRAHKHFETRRKRWIDLHGEDPVKGIRGIPPFQHREVDYEFFDHPERTSSIYKLTAESEGFQEEDDGLSPRSATAYNSSPNRKLPSKTSRSLIACICSFAVLVFTLIQAGVLVIHVNLPESFALTEFNVSVGFLVGGAFLAAFNFFAYN